MIKSGDKVVCIRLDYLDGEGRYSELPFNIGDTFYIKINYDNTCIHINGYAFGLKNDNIYLRYFSDYFITYNEWLALQREEQIKSVLDE